MRSAGSPRRVGSWGASDARRQGNWGHQGVVTAVAFSRDGKTLATASGRQTKEGDPLPGEIKLWNPATGELGGSLADLEGHLGGVSSLAFSRDGKTLASGSGLADINLQTGTFHSGEVRIWDVARRQERQLLRGHTNFVAAVAFHPEGRNLATAGLDRLEAAWQAVKAEERKAKS